MLATAAVLAAGAAIAGIGPVWAGLGWLAIALAALIPQRGRRVLADSPQMTQALADWDKVIGALLDSIDVPAFLLGGDGQVVFENRPAADLFGSVPRGDHLSARIRSPGILDMVQDALRTFRTSTIEHSERFPSERWYQVRIAPVHALPGLGPEGPYFLLTFRDLTEARRMDRMRSDFVANASHELRTPLASLTGFIETMQGPARTDPAAQKRFLAIMHEQAMRMTRLVDDLMSLSRLELKAHVAPSAEVDLVTVLRHVCDTLRPLADDVGVDIRFTRPEAPVLVTGDRDELIQVFENLVENACKYAQSGKVVDITLKERPGPGGRSAIEATVRDYGPGIPPEHVPRLTERFYRVDIATSRSQKGTGLGLAIVKHILTRHRARLIVRSQIGEGSVFVVRFAPPM